MGDKNAIKEKTSFGQKLNKFTDAMGVWLVVLLFFIIPIKMKYMALFSGALCLIDLLMGGWSTRAAVLLSLANFLLFFGGDFFRTVKQEIKYHKTRRTWQNQNRSNWR